MIFGNIRYIIDLSCLIKLFLDWGGYRFVVNKFGDIYKIYWLNFVKICSFVCYLIIINIIKYNSMIKNIFWEVKFYFFYKRNILLYNVLVYRKREIESRVNMVE